MGLLIKLQNGDTALKSLKFGKDRPGGGESGQPYIQNPIDKVSSPANTDFLLRGGINAPLNAAEDVARLTKYMFNPKSPSGLLFIAKQNLLSRVAPKTESSKGIAYGGGAFNEGIYTPISTLAQAGVGFLGIHLNKQGIDPTGLLPGLSIRKYEDTIKTQEENRLVTLTTLVDKGRSQNNFNFIKGYSLNVGNDLITYGGGPGSVLGIGKTNIRFADQRTGINNPLSKTNVKYFYEGGLTRPQTVMDYYNTLGASEKYGLTRNQIGLNIEGQFLRRLYSADTPYSTLSFNNQGLILTGSEGYQANELLKTITQESDSTYYSPIGGILQNYERELLSDSSFIIGGTWRATSQKNNQQIPEYSSKPSLAIDSGAEEGLTNTQISRALNQSEPDSNQNGYLANLNKNSGPYIDPNTNIYTFTNNPLREGGRGIAGDFRLTNRKKRGFYDDPDAYDRITDSTDYSSVKTLDKIYYNAGASKRTSTPLNSSSDIIPFRISIVNPLFPGDSTKTEVLNFRAYIDNFSDAYNAEWKAVSYMGRAEKQYKYNAFGRSISLGFTIVADNSANLGIMYDQLNLLASSLAPTYTSQGYMAGNLHRLTLGNYLYEQWGIIEGLSYEVTDDTPYEITPGIQLPLYIRVSGIKFTPIHNFRPEYLKPSLQDTTKPYQFINQNTETNSPLNSNG